MSAVALVALVTANLGTATAEFAGIAAGSELLGISRYVAVPLSAVLVGWLVLAGSFHRVEHVLMALAAVFVAYVAAGFLAHPDWSAAFTGLVTPRMSFGHEETLIVAATVGTTLAPWGLSFIGPTPWTRSSPPRTWGTSAPTSSWGRADRGDRLLRRGRVCGHPAQAWFAHQRRCGRRRGADTPRG